MCPILGAIVLTHYLHVYDLLQSENKSYIVLLFFLLKGIQRSNIGLSVFPRDTSACSQAGGSNCQPCGWRTSSLITCHSIRKSKNVNSFECQCRVTDTVLPQQMVHLLFGNSVCRSWFRGSNMEVHRLLESDLLPKWKK